MSVQPEKNRLFGSWREFQVRTAVVQGRNDRYSRQVVGFVYFVSFCDHLSGPGFRGRQRVSLFQSSGDLWGADPASAGPPLVELSRMRGTRLSHGWLSAPGKGEESFAAPNPRHPRVGDKSPMGKAVTSLRSEGVVYGSDPNTQR